MISVFKQFVKKRLLWKSLLLIRLPQNKKNSILLTFDDGPDPNVTPRVLELLAQYKVKAIFFIPGRRIERAPELLVEIIKQGHQIGNHTFIHSNGKQPGFLSYWRDIKHCQKMIIDNCGVRPRFFRPPCGVVSFTTLLAPRLVGLRVMNWSLDTNDWQCKSKEEAAVMAGEFIDRARSGDIVLLHDDNQNVVHILRSVLPTLVEKSFDLKSGVASVGKVM